MTDGAGSSKIYTTNLQTKERRCWVRFIHTVSDTARHRCQTVQKRYSVFNNRHCPQAILSIIDPSGRSILEQWMSIRLQNDHVKCHFMSRRDNIFIC